MLAEVIDDPPRSIHSVFSIVVPVFYYTLADSFAAMAEALTVSHMGTTHTSIRPRALHALCSFLLLVLLSAFAFDNAPAVFCILLGVRWWCGEDKHFNVTAWS